MKRSSSLWTLGLQGELRDDMLGEAGGHKRGPRTHLYKLTYN